MKAKIKVMIQNSNYLYSLPPKLIKSKLKNINQFNLITHLLVIIKLMGSLLKSETGQLQRGALTPGSIASLDAPPTLIRSQKKQVYRCLKASLSNNI